MKCTYFLALTVTLAPAAAVSSMYQNIESQCNGDKPCIKKMAEEETASRASSYFQYAYGKLNGKSMFINDLCYAGGSAPISPGNYRYKDVSAIYSSSDCENYANAIFTEWTAQWSKKISDYEQGKKAQEQEEEHRATEQQRAKAARVSALKAGQAKPANLKEAAIAYNAEHGGSLASGPKIRPDGAMYYMNGKIKMAGDRPEFLAALSSSQDNELLANALRRSRGMGESTDYFAVVIPDQLQKYYFNGAKIEGGFDLVGRYVSNTKYKTAAGQEKSAPVFEAIYLVFWQ